MWPIILLVFLIMDLYFPRALCVSHHAATAVGTPRRILSCNIRGLPLVNGWGYHGRLREFLRDQKPFYDTIVLQEVFMRGVRNVVRGALEPEFNTVYRPSLVAGNGLVIASRYNITSSEAITFEPCSGTDCLAQKGAMGVQIGDLFLVTTHLQDATWDSSARIRVDQMRDIHRMCQNKDSVLVVGDFNTPPDSPLVVSSLGMEVVSSGHQTHDYGELDYAVAKGPYRWRCLLLQDEPPADHRGVVLERDEHETNAPGSVEDGRRSSAETRDPAPDGTCARV